MLKSLSSLCLYKYCVKSLPRILLMNALPGLLIRFIFPLSLPDNRYYQAYVYSLYLANSPINTGKKPVAHRLHPMIRTPGPSTDRARNRHPVRQSIAVSALSAVCRERPEPCYLIHSKTPQTRPKSLLVQARIISGFSWQGASTAQLNKIPDLCLTSSWSKPSGRMMARRQFRANTLFPHQPLLVAG